MLTERFLDDEHLPDVLTLLHDILGLAAVGDGLCLYDDGEEEWVSFDLSKCSILRNCFRTLQYATPEEIKQAHAENLRRAREKEKQRRLEWEKKHPKPAICQETVWVQSGNQLISYKVKGLDGDENAD